MTIAFKCPVCASVYFGPIFEDKKHVGRFCKGWPSGYDRSYMPCRGRHEERFDALSIVSSIEKSEAVSDLTPKPLVALTDEQIDRIVSGLEVVTTYHQFAIDLVRSGNAEFCRVNGMTEPKP